MPPKRVAKDPETVVKASGTVAKAKTVAKAPKTVAKAKSVNVTFSLPAEVQADTVALCGEFNEWSPENVRLERNGDGSWQAVVALEPGRTYRYRYFLDGQRWENAWHADGYVPNPYGGDDSVIVVERPTRAGQAVTASASKKPGPR